MFSNKYVSEKKRNERGRSKQKVNYFRYFVFIESKKFGVFSVVCLFGNS